MQSITTLLIEHPRIGQQTDLAGIRRMLVSPYPYLIFYRVTEDAVIVQRVRHAARDPSDAPRRAYGGPRGQRTNNDYGCALSVAAGIARLRK